MSPYETLIWICQQNAFCLLTVDYAEGCNEYTVNITTNEIENPQFYVKRTPKLEYAVEMIINDMKATAANYMYPPPVSP